MLCKEQVHLSFIFFFKYMIQLFFLPLYTLWNTQLLLQLASSVCPKDCGASQKFLISGLVLFVRGSV